MADPKITLKWADNNADETGHQVHIANDPWKGTFTKVKDVAADVTSVDLTLAEITTDPAFLKVAAVRDAEIRMSKESALAVTSPVVTGAGYNKIYGKIGELPSDIAVPKLVKGTPKSFPRTRGVFDLNAAFTVTPDGKLFQFYQQKAVTLDLTTGVETVDMIPRTFSQDGSGLCFASDGNIYLMGYVGGDKGVFRYKMDGEAPELVATWLYSDGAGGKISPAVIKQGKNERLYMFGGYNSITAANELVVNSVNMDGTDKKTDIITIPAGWGSNPVRMLYTPDDKIVIWEPTQTQILVYDPVAVGGATVTPYAAGTDLGSDSGTTPSSLRTMVPQNSWAVLIMGKGRFICQFQYEDDPSWVTDLPVDFVASAQVNTMYDSQMGWLFVGNTSGSVFCCRLDSKSDGEVTYSAADLGLTGMTSGPDFVRIGKTVYVVATSFNNLMVCPFDIESAWQSTGPYDAASIANTNARNRNGSN